MKNTTPDQNKYKEIKRAQPNRTNALCQLGEAFFSVFSKTMKNTTPYQNTLKIRRTKKASTQQNKCSVLARWSQAVGNIDIIYSISNVLCKHLYFIDLLRLLFVVWIQNNTKTKTNTTWFKYLLSMCFFAKLKQFIQIIDLIIYVLLLWSMRRQEQHTMAQKPGQCTRSVRLGSQLVGRHDPAAWNDSGKAPR